MNDSPIDQQATSRMRKNLILCRKISQDPQKYSQTSCTRSKSCGKKARKRKREQTSFTGWVSLVETKQYSYIGNAYPPTGKDGQIIRISSVMHPDNECILIS